MYSRKYQIVGEKTAGQSGTLVDVGARDRVLLKHLRAPDIRYLSADMGQGHDFVWNLEEPIPQGDSAFDFVVALDVLEHVENTQAALRELIRIARRKVFISLPNLASLSFRLHFMRHGELSDKYALLPQHQGDRHRWLTTYDQSRMFVEGIARPLGCKVRQYDIYEDRSILGIAHYFWRCVPLGPSLRTYTMVFEIDKPPVSNP